MNYGIVRSTWDKMMLNGVLLKRPSRSIILSPSSLFYSTAHSDSHHHRHAKFFAERKHEHLPYKTSDYETLYKRALANPAEFWSEQASKLTWTRDFNKVLHTERKAWGPHCHKWFMGGNINTCYNAVDRHVEAGKGDQPAVIYDSPITGQKAKITYKELQEKVSIFGGVLKNHCIRKNDRVVIYMPSIPEALIAMLASARLGAIHSVVFGGFSAKELAARISHCQPKVVITASAGVEPNRIQDYQPIVDEAIKISSSKPQSVIIYQRPGLGNVTLKKGRDYDWESELQRHADPTEPEFTNSNQPLYILYTSGTTGAPKGIVRTIGGHAVVLPWSMQVVFGMEPNETFWTNSDLGWVLGHSYICYAPLLYGMTTVLYEGKPVGTPDAAQFFRVISEHDVRGFYVAPTALRAVRQRDPEGALAKQYVNRVGWNLRAVFTVGEHLDIETRRWTEHIFKAPVLDTWWQTESGWPITATCLGTHAPNIDPPKDASGKPVPGWDVQVVNTDGRPVAPGQLGRIVIKEPLPLGSLQTFWEADERFADTYFKLFPGFYDTMDAGIKTEDHYICVMSRADDVINVAGHRLSCGALEEAVLRHKDVFDCAVIGLDDSLKGTVPLALCVVGEDFKGNADTLKQEVIDTVRDHVGPVAALRHVLVIKRLPKTRSGKIARNTLQAMANNQPFKIPITIEDASVYPELKQVMQTEGLALTGPDPE